MAVHTHLGLLRTPQEIEQIVTTCVRAFDTADKPTRRVLSRLIGHLLASTQTPISRPAEPSKKNASKKDQQGSDEENSVSTPAATTTQTEVLSPESMLAILATHFHKATTHRRARIALAESYAALFTTLGRAWTESHYTTIAAHLLSLVDHPRLKAASVTMPAHTVQYERLLVRQIVGALLRQRTLSERGQIAAVRALASNYLSKYPAVMPGSVAPSPEILVVCLIETAALLDQLGNSPPPVQDALAEPLGALLAHPVYTVQVAAARTLCSFCSAAPNRLAPTVSSVLDQLQKDVSGLGNQGAPPDLGRRAAGRAKALAALLSLAPARPMYVSGELAAKVLESAVGMLKRSGEHPVQAAAVEVECAWGLISALTALGGTFVRAHLASLLALWRNAVPKVGARDSGGGRSVEEWAFLLHVRGSAVGALGAFLESCGPGVGGSGGLVTLDVGRRLTTLLSNALGFANAAHTYLGSLEHESPAVLGLGLGLRELEHVLRARTFECFSLLGCGALADSAQTELLKSAIGIFAGAGVGGGVGAMQAAIASAAGEAGDGYVWGVSSLAVGVDEERKDRDSVEEELDRLVRPQHIRLFNVLSVIIMQLTQPILGSLENNPLLLCSPSRRGEAWPRPPPPATALTDAAINLFVSLLPTQQDPASVQSCVSLLVESSRPPRTAGRRAAIQLNTAVALARMLRHANEGAGRKARENLGSSNVVGPLSELLQVRPASILDFHDIDLICRAQF